MDCLDNNKTPLSRGVFVYFISFCLLVIRVIQTKNDCSQGSSS